MNKKIKIALAAVLAACSLLNITGCSENTGGIPNSPDSGVSSPNDSGSSDNVGGDDKSIGSTEVIKTQYAPITLTDNNTVNSIRLFDAITADKENAMFSPLSLNMALGLIEVGAAGETKAALDSFLQTENYADFAERYMKRAAEELTFESRYDEQKNVLEIANSFFAHNTYPFKDSYKQSVSEKFGAEVKNLDFGDKDNTLKEINGWVNEKTHEMIPSVLKNYGDDTVGVLVNTVYFESAWREKWSVNENNKETFMLSDGTVKEIPLMYNVCGDYFENDHATAFGCNYNNHLQFIGILPKESGEFTLESLDIPSLLESRSYNYDVSAVMPKLKFDTDIPLKNLLCAAGLENIFDKNAADFSGMADMTAGRLYVSDAVQKTSLELDENGTKASAATAIIMANECAVEPKELKTVRLDRPFAFMIYDEQEQQILFVGKVTTVDN